MDESNARGSNSADSARASGGVESIDETSTDSVARDRGSNGAVNADCVGASSGAESNDGTCTNVVRANGGTLSQNTEESNKMGSNSIASVDSTRAGSGTSSQNADESSNGANINGASSASTSPIAEGSNTRACDSNSSASESIDKWREDIAKEVASMDRLARLIQFEFFHYAKHKARDWWNSMVINHLKTVWLREKPGKRGLIILDHKNKMDPGRQNEPQNDYFQKTGMSLLGSGCMFPGLRGGINTRFIDIIMQNTNEQKARDLLPCLEALVEELSKELYSEACAGIQY